MVSGRPSSRIALVDASAKGYVWLLVGPVPIGLLAANGTFAYQFDDKRHPVSAVEFLKREHLKGNMFNDDEFGDYIIYAAWPKYKVFFDGRSDMYGAARFKEYFKIIGVKPDWEAVIDKYNIDWIIYKANSALSVFLMEREDWRLVYVDKVANIFVKHAPENEPIINKYPDVQPILEEDESEKAE